MKIAVFENEFSRFESAFAALNLMYFNNSLEISVFPASQDFGDMSGVFSYDRLIIDLDLAKKTHKDGYEIAAEALALGYPQNHIFIMTGHVDVEAHLMQKGFPKLNIINKPISFQKLKQALD